MDKIILNEGKLYQSDPKRNMRASFSYTDPVSDARKRHFVTIKTKDLKEAKRLLPVVRDAEQEKLNAALAQEEKRGEVTGDQTLRKHANDYIERRAKTKSVELNTTAKNRADIGRLEWVLDIDIQDLKPEDLEKRLGELIESGLSVTTVRSTYKMANQLCAYLVKRKRLAENPFEDVVPPKKQKAKINFLNSEQRKQLVDYLQAMPQSQLNMSVLIALCTGMRRGEICGLRWENIDLIESRITVEGSIMVNGTTAYRKAPKNNTFRVVPLIPELRVALEEWKGNFPRKCEQHYVVGDFGIKTAFYNPTVLTREWRSLSKSMGLNCTFHDLRHTFATYMVGRRCDIKTLATILGHANTTITLELYAAPDPDALNWASNIMRGLMNGGSGFDFDTSAKDALKYTYEVFYDTDGFHAVVKEFPDIKVTDESPRSALDGALAAVAQRLRG